MSDNLPYDFVIYFNNKFYKCQVKSTSGKNSSDVLVFDLTSNNWNKKEVHKYTTDEIDIIICCDLNKIYLFNFSEIKDKSKLYLRDKPTKNNQIKNVNFIEDCIISEKRITEIFT